MDKIQRFCSVHVVLRPLLEEFTPATTNINSYWSDQNNTSLQTAFPPILPRKSIHSSSLSWRITSHRRYQFHNCTPSEGESITAFAANLKQLASTCELVIHLNEALRDRFLCGLSSNETPKIATWRTHLRRSAWPRSFRKRCCCVRSSWFSVCEKGRHRDSSSLSPFKVQGTPQARQV